ncbi:capsule assembly Wzi family protein [Shewanella sp. Scap07]|uniref:capsule assembly Wzi family protein n=1 Tax=Shewanella sp. Scap07 TaxID=2589987 RepID=UPI0015BE8796|nr:capsule assembly Wzi family protein [Shewanella sp. Scap07]QLE87511.1 capsule assembly Wzi family protein [Shewanella sp. Scap07]
MMFIKQKLIASCIALFAFFGSAQLVAAPWVDTSDIYLRADIQALADAGVITVPINTYPLMWSGIGQDLAKAEPSLMSAGLVDAFARVNFYYRRAVGNFGNTSIKAAAATDPARFQHFGSDYREQGDVKVSHEYLGDRFAVKVSASAHYDPADDKEVRLDDSYFAMALGNWMVTAGTIDQWWGPGFDSALHRSSNARPMPSLMLTRNNASAFETPWLSWIGPWTLTTGISRLEEERAVENPLLWSFRGTIRPLRQLELGFSWTTMFCGEGEPCDIGTLWDAISGNTECANGASSCDPAMETKIGNQMAGFDARYADTWFDIPVGIYLERTCEDSSGPMPWDLADCAKMFGVDTRIDFDNQQYKLFFEYSDTMVACGTNQNVFNCFYEHSTYKSGSRYYERSLGSTYDSDAVVYALGMVGQFSNSRGITSILRYAQLNKDGSSPGHGWAPQPRKEDLLMLELSYRMPIWQGMMSIGGTVSQSEFESADKDTDATLFGTYEYRF